MTWPLLLRRSYGIRLLPVMILIWCYGALGNPPSPSDIERSASVLYAFMMIAGPVALGACLELRRFTEGHILTTPTGRSRLRIILPWWAIAVLPSTVAVGISVLASGSGNQIMEMSAIGAVWMLAWGVFGAAIGASWPLALSAPTALLLPFILVLYGPAVSVMELRYLFGYYMGCCTVGEMLNPRVLTAGMTMAGGILIVSALALVAGRRNHHARITVTLTLIIGLVATTFIGFHTVKGIGPLPATPRTRPQICLRGSDPVVCAWESHDLELLGPVIRKADTAWRNSGIHVPEEYRQGTQDSTRETVWWSASAISTSESPSKAVLAVASGLAVAPCQDHKDQVAVWVLDTQDRVVAWLTKHSGIAMTGQEFSPETREWLKSMDRLPIQDQARIVESYRSRLQKC